MTGGRILGQRALAPITCFTYAMASPTLTSTKVAQHRRFGKLITVSAVHPEGRLAISK